MSPLHQPKYSRGSWEHLGAPESWRAEGMGGLWEVAQEGQLPALFAQHNGVSTGRTSWCWTSSLRRSTMKPLSRRKLMTLLGFSVTPLTFLWGPKMQNSGSQPWKDEGLVGKVSHRAAASYRLAEGWNAAECPLSCMFPMPLVLLTLVPCLLCAPPSGQPHLLAHPRLPVGCIASPGDHLPLLLPRRHRGADGPVHWCQHPHHLGDPGLHL